MNMMRQKLSKIMEVTVILEYEAIRFWIPCSVGATVPARFPNKAGQG